MPRTTQPQGPVRIDWSNQLAGGLVFAHFGATQLPVLGRKPTSILGTLAARTDRLGTSFEFSGSQALRFGYAPAIPTGTGATLLIVTSTDIGATAGICLSIGSGGSSTPLVNLSPYSLFYRGDGGTTWNPTLTEPPKGVPHVTTAVLNTGAGEKSLWLDGVKRQTSLTDIGAQSLNVAGIGYSAGHGTGYHDGPIYLAVIFNRALSDAEVVDLSANPWQLFAPIDRQIWTGLSDSITVTPQFPYAPTSDITTTGWIATPAGGFYATLDEVAYDDSDYITSPDLSSPAPIIMGLPATMPAGTYSISIRAKYTGTSGQVKATLLNDANEAQGASSWQAILSSAGTYELLITTTGDATRIKLEVQS